MSEIKWNLLQEEKLSQQKKSLERSAKDKTEVKKTVKEKKADKKSENETKKSQTTMLNMLLDAKPVYCRRCLKKSPPKYKKYGLTATRLVQCETTDWDKVARRYIGCYPSEFTFADLAALWEKEYKPFPFTEQSLEATK